MPTGLQSKLFANLYKDSVTLMQLSAALRGTEGIEEASCLMATPANLEQLQHAGLAVEARAAPSDLLVVVRGDPAACAAALNTAAGALLSAGTAAARDGAAFELPVTSLAQAIGREPMPQLALISVPGDYAAAEAMKALRLGLHVMLFSDNVSLAEELVLKKEAVSRSLLVMGPDCGTAIINGVPLGFANVVRRGDIGLVAASGTGLQEVTCRIHHAGGGVSQAIGTGGRDLKEAIGGITMLQGLQALAADAATRVIVLVSKPPATGVAREIERAARAAGKPVVMHFLGADRAAGAGAAGAAGEWAAGEWAAGEWAAGEWAAGEPAAGESAASRKAAARIVNAGSLREAADIAVALSRGDPLPPLPLPGAAAVARMSETVAAMQPGQRKAVALFTGGTFCYEAQLAFIGAEQACRSNAPAPGSRSAVGPLTGRPGELTAGDGHLFLDLGEDEFTRGRPHPMIDPAPRDALLRGLGRDEHAAVLLFDLVLGHGAHADPATGLAAALAQALADARTAGRRLLAIGHVCGTERDPQDRGSQVARLEAAGALILPSNIEAAMLAAQATARLGVR